MPETSKPPAFDRLLEDASDPVARTITMVIGNSLGQAARIEMNAGLVGPLVAVLLSHLTSLNTGLSEAERSDSAVLTGQAAWVSQNAEGSPVLVFELSSGALVPIAVHAGSLGALAAELSLLAKDSPGPAH